MTFVHTMHAQRPALVSPEVAVAFGRQHQVELPHLEMSKGVHRVQFHCRLGLTQRFHQAPLLLQSIREHETCGRTFRLQGKRGSGILQRVRCRLGRAQQQPMGKDRQQPVIVRGKLDRLLQKRDRPLVRQ